MKSVKGHHKSDHKEEKPVPPREEVVETVGVEGEIAQVHDTVTVSDMNPAGDHALGTEVGEDAPSITVPDIIERPKKSMKISKGTVAALLIAIAVIGGAYACKSLFIAAMVNGSPVSRLAVIHELEKQNGGQVLDLLIVKKMIADEAKKRGVTVTDADVDAEIASLTAEVVKQGATLDLLLQMQGMKMEDLREQIRLQKLVEKMAAPDVTVTPAEVDSYIKDNKIPLTKGQEEEQRAEIEKQIIATKKNDAGQKFVSDLRSKAKIVKFVSY